MEPTREEWRAVVGFEGAYEVSNLGRVKSLERFVKARSGGQRLRPEVMLKGSDHNNGYRRVSLSFNGKQAVPMVHCLVAEAFIGPRPDGFHVCHNDGDPGNNTLANLRYDTPFGNYSDRKQHGTEYKLRNTHCPQGHEYSGNNLMIRPSNSKCGGVKRVCRICHRENTRRSRARAAAAAEKAAA